MRSGGRSERGRASAASSSQHTPRESACHSTDSRSTAGERDTAGRRSDALRGGSMTPRSSTDREDRASSDPDAPPPSPCTPRPPSIAEAGNGSTDRCSVASLSRSSAGDRFAKAPRRVSAISRVRALTRTMMLGSRRSGRHHASAATLASSTASVVGTISTSVEVEESSGQQQGRGSAASSQGVCVAAADRQTCGEASGSEAVPSTRPVPARGFVVCASGGISVDLPQHVLVTLDSASDHVAIPIADSLASGRGSCTSP